VKAVQLIELRKHIPRYLLTRAVGAVYPPVSWGPLSLIQYGDVPEPALPGPEWVRIGTRYGGICGTDMGLVFLKVNPALEAFVSLPMVLGHENVGTITEIGDEVEGFAVGDRVVADPLLPCAARGIGEPCELCRRGDFSLCQNFAEGHLAPGFSIGFCRETGGSWSRRFVAQQSQLYRLPEGVSDENGVMLEPFSVALHAVMRKLPEDDDFVLVIGGGTIGLCVVVALRTLGSRAHIIVVAKYRFQGEMARRLGADRVVYPAEQDVLEVVAEATGGRRYTSVMGQDLLVGGADVVYECVGTKRSVRDSLSLAASGGTVVLVGLPAVLRRTDWTPIWLKELTIIGSVWSGTETFEDRSVPTYELIVKWMAEGRLDLTPMVTHRFALDEYKKALAVTANKGRHHAIKSVFAFD
jgi:threonine dehydrogenase-like Zn-dependent dehydrogenase